MRNRDGRPSFRSARLSQAAVASESSFAFFSAGCKGRHESPRGVCQSHSERTRAERSGQREIGTARTSLLDDTELPGPANLAARLRFFSSSSSSLQFVIPKSCQDILHRSARSLGTTADSDQKKRPVLVLPRTSFSAPGRPQRPLPVPPAPPRHSRLPSSCWRQRPPLSLPLRLRAQKISTPGQCRRLYPPLVAAAAAAWVVSVAVRACWNRERNRATRVTAGPGGRGVHAE